MKMVVLKNPFWEAVQKFPRDKIAWEFDHVWRPEWHSSASRNDLCGKYAWAIPDPDSLRFVAQALSPKAIEIGAGTGYWASLLTQLGVDMLCYDLNPPQHTGHNNYHSPRNEQGTALLGITRDIFFDVRAGNHLMAANYPDRTLFLCWPPYDNDMAYNALQAYTGKRLVYIGEDEGGCTADEAFFTLLSEAWHIVDEHIPVQWSGIHDIIQVYERGMEAD